jgi:predicted RNA-binding protein associated with RNAse of E/G family
MRFERGQVIVRRGMHPDGRIGAVQAGRVVTDDEDGLLLWVDIQSATMRRVRLDGHPTRALPIREELTTPTLLAPASWQPYRTLMWMPPSAAHSIWWSWTAAQTFAGYYINLEEPIRRWAGGIDVNDHALDLLIAADGTHTWKDEDEFATQTGDPLFWDSDTAATIRAEGERLLDHAAQGVFPFDGTWRDFKPDPVWTPAQLPHWWDVPAHGSTLWDDTFYRLDARHHDPHSQPST